ncbi:KN motif and ankyrin repeat domain-containing protein 3 [Achaetomium macrosporum]|uniref:KN motif and ankyrin repeat domain-containing protein 3 n=1 Tax=Achaetomium macrosporum TaxID=79813 RepID=A0AAN7C1N1_9PEZI|nr:KN motif and ankyrin repeat domain-containing protein 3 [Achaetomium macrosporum]
MPGPVDVMTRRRPGQPRVVHLASLYGCPAGDDYDIGFGTPPPTHSRQSSTSTVSRSNSAEMASPPAPNATGAPSSGSRIGRPPQWTTSRSRKLARLYLYSTLSIEKIIEVLEGDGFNPRKNSAQKTIHKMLDNDPRYLRPESRMEMNKRINSLAMSSKRRRRRKAAPGQCTAVGRGSVEREEVAARSEVTSPSGQSIKAEGTPSFGFSPSPDPPSFSYFSIPFRGQGQGQERAGAPEPSEDARPEEIRDIKRRVSGCSTHYAFQLSSLIKEYTISISSDDDRSCGRRPSVALSEGSQPGDPTEFGTAPEAYEAFPDPGFALPGGFLTAHTWSCADFPGQQHGKGDCWCSIAQETSADENSWLLPSGELSARAHHVLEQPSSRHFNRCDSFGNTELHLFAALDGYRETLLRIVLNGDTGKLWAVNSAGQTFLHLLNLEWFTDLASPSSPLKRLLAYILDSCPELVYETDVYGRNFFHRAHSVVRDPTALGSLISLFNPSLASRRDAFGFNPVHGTDPSAPSPYIPPRRMDRQTGEDMARPRPSHRPPSSDEGSFLAYHARLVQVIQSSYTTPHIEDAEGRNGLHCLAEAIISQQTMDRHVQGVQRASSSSSSSSISATITAAASSSTFLRPHLKRKLSKDAPGSSPLSSSSTNGSSSATTTTTTTTTEAPLPTRLRHLQSLLHPSVSVSVSHYDLRGYTPLMAFIEHIPDDQDDKSRTLQAIIETLIRASPKTMEARNRRGETALLMAARLGRKVALATLLEMGANVHVRDVWGHGVLEVLDVEVKSPAARADVSLYARLEACRALLTGRRDWGVGYVGPPGSGAVVREWGVRGGFQGRG